MKKILIVYATAGIGHKKAAMAAKEALDEIRSKEVESAIIDALDYTNAFFKWSYLQAYLLMVNKLPTFWGLAYYLTDNFYFNLVISAVRRLNNWLNSRKLEKYLLSYNPDVVISTHFFASEVISDLKRRGLFKGRLITVVTDYRLHLWWLADNTDMYIVGGEDAKEDLLKRGVPSRKVLALGIPIEPVFSKKMGRDDILKKADLKEEPFTVLVIGGGFGVGPIEDVVKAILEVSGSIQLAVICGHNEELAKRIKSLTAASNIRAKILGFVNNVYEYMEISDILISKSGGITITESLAKVLPMVIIAPIIGQETRNSSFVVGHGAAVRIRRPQDLKGVLEYLMSNPENLEKMKESIRALRKPEACYDIAKMAIDLCGRGE